MAWRWKAWRTGCTSTRRSSIDDKQGEIVGFWKQIVNKTDGTQDEIYGIGGSWFRLNADALIEWQRDFFDFGHVAKMFANLIESGDLSAGMQKRIERSVAGEKLPGYYPLGQAPSRSGDPPGSQPGDAGHTVAALRPTFCIAMAGRPVHRHTGQGIRCRSFMKTKGALIWEFNQPWSIEEIEIGDPHKDEVKIQMEAAGMCHSDHHLVTGGIPMAGFPVLGGHEGAGIVTEVGPGVEDLAPGDHVVLSFIPSCGTVSDLSGRPAQPVRPGRRAARRRGGLRRHVPHSGPRPERLPDDAAGHVLAVHGGAHEARW